MPLDDIDKDESNQEYLLALQDTYKAYKSLTDTDTIKIYLSKFGVSSTDAIESVLSIVSLGWTMIKEIKEMQDAKVDGIINILDNLRLSSPADLSKNLEEDE
ncbi:MAG: hypothetical protein KDC60_00280 [Bacteroidetes bacterium]|nr:hypothetical protein [Bacteroidota bacterium]